MKLGASATSPGVFVRWNAARETCQLRRLGFIRGIVRRARAGWSAWAWKRGDVGIFTHRCQAKRAVEAAVSQALREAE